LSERAQAIIDVLQLEYGYSQRAIGEECGGYTWEHINRVKNGKRQASADLENDLYNFLQECDRTQESFKYRPYIWKAGHDPRKRNGKTQAKAIQSPNIPPQPSPNMPQKTTPKPVKQCRGCQTTERKLRWFNRDGGIWLCEYCVVPRWINWKDGSARPVA
jgi:hypothetical protein